MSTSLDDFVKAIEDEAGFSRIKKLSSQENVIEGKKENGNRNSRIVDAPLPIRQQMQISRQLAYSQASRKIGRWAPLIKQNREAKTVSFKEDGIGILSSSIGEGRVLSLAPSLSEKGMNAKENFKPRTLFEKEFQKVALSLPDQMSEFLEPLNEINGDENGEKERDFSMNPLLSSEKLSSEELLRIRKTSGELAKERSLRFFKLKKEARQAKIKSKSYHKHLKRATMKEKLKEENDLANEPFDEEGNEKDEKRRIKAEIDRAKERLTLKTRQASRWARDFMRHRNLDKDSEQFSIIREQLESKERLRQEILTDNKQYENEEEEEDEESEEDYQEEKNLLIDGKLTESEGEYDNEGEKDNNRTDSLKETLSEKKNEKNDSDSDDNHSKEKVIGRRKFNMKNSVDDEKNRQEIIQRVFKEESENEETLDADGLAMLEKFQMENELDKRVGRSEGKGEMLPGWGSWSGAGMFRRRHVGNDSNCNTFPNPPPLDEEGKGDKMRKTRIVINEKGEGKVFIKKFTIPKVPFPYKSREEFEMANRMPIGPDWNSVTNFQKRIQPRIQVEAGTVINPIKYVKLIEKDNDEEVK